MPTWRNDAARANGPRRQTEISVHPCGTGPSKDEAVRHPGGGGEKNLQEPYPPEN